MSSLDTDFIRLEYRLSDWTHQFELSNGSLLNLHRSNKWTLSNLDIQGGIPAPDGLCERVHAFLDGLDAGTVNERIVRAKIDQITTEHDALIRRMCSTDSGITRKVVPDFLRKTPIGRTIGRTPKKRTSHGRRRRRTISAESGWSQAIARKCEEIAFEHLRDTMLFECPTSTHVLGGGVVRFINDETGQAHRDLIWKNHDGEQYDSWDLELRNPADDAIIHHFEVKAETPGLTEGEYALWSRHGDHGFTALRVIPESGRVTQEIIQSPSEASRPHRLEQSPIRVGGPLLSRNNANHYSGRL